MGHTLRWHFWFETGSAIVTGILLVITLVWHDWIEIVFSVDPDNRSGTFEWLIVAMFLAVSITLFTLASYEWRRTWTAIS